MQHPPIRKSWHSFRRDAAVGIVRSQTKATESLLLFICPMHAVYFNSPTFFQYNQPEGRKFSFTAISFYILQSSLRGHSMSYNKTEEFIIRAAQLAEGWQQAACQLVLLDRKD
jgi:hypothetical protein